ncbi:DDT domain-containing protein PTM [Phoenix dactylifera]|uniref:DDT domain-containing protein PTM n=1 Tax=Phoenix dactylifera TaxID=42345 RepID=A0A8B8J3T8_PHODC|nr:DDT domain-containing protein PTM [Phoenix dactylifera]XP_008787593.2 DDT domain-containing protein PTM [Phoenix dactylifera]XP_026659876.2 DDT domain-containing protein PTM [Phoenix dactylifera]XP_026659877.2 DDT domain-containing protein PTM [Phoenix dactylifera]XP_026659878.2 DDT domain-containing protein PTM [Phoenix dactylifera]
MELVGRAVRKRFPGFGIFEGVVESYDPSVGYFKVVYEDGDSEEVDFGEIALMLTEMGESSPLPQGPARRSNRGRRPKKRRRSEPDRAARGGSGGGAEDELLRGKVMGKGLVGEGGNVVEVGGVSVENGGISDGVVKENGVLVVGGAAHVNGDCSNGDIREIGSLQVFEGTPKMEKLKEKDGFDGTDGSEMKSKALVAHPVETTHLEGCKDTPVEELLLKDCNSDYVSSESQGGGSAYKVDEDEQGPKKRQRLSEKPKSPPEMPLRRSARRASAALLSLVDSVPHQVETNVLASENAVFNRKDYGLIAEDSKLELPPSSNDVNLDGLSILDIFSVYTCLRSFSRLLFLSPFHLEAFVAALRCKFVNSLIDSIHLSLLQALKQHLEFLSEEGSRSAADCLRNLNWELLDLITWPVYLAEYLLVHCPSVRCDFKLTHLKLLNMEYYKQPAGVKLEVLRCLCDDVNEVEMIRSELNARRMIEIEPNPDVFNSMNIVRKKNYLSTNGLANLSSAQEEFEETADGNSDECRLCKMDGSLICCDGCPAAFHSRCVGVAKDLLPEGDWYCPECLIEKGDGLVNLSKSCQGAEILGIDPHGRLYFRCCGYLLVSDSCDTVAPSHYYNKNDLVAVIRLLKSSHASYSAIVDAISSYWKVTVNASNSSNHGHEIPNVHEVLDASVHSEHLTLSKQEVSFDGIIEKAPKDYSASPGCSEPNRLSTSDLRQLNLMDSRQSAEINQPFAHSESADEMADAATCDPISRQIYNDCSRNENVPDKEFISVNPVELSVDNEKYVELPGWGVGTSLITDRWKGADSRLQSDPGCYMNYYTFGRIAFSVAQELMHKSSESGNKESKKPVEDMMSQQLKAISKKSIRFCWCTNQKLSLDAQKEKCGWCHSCKTLNGSNCLFKIMDDKHLESSKPRIVGLRSEKKKKSHILSAMHHILSIEDRLRCFLSGPWEKPHYSNLWRKAVLKASDVASLKHLLLTLESNLRRVALSAEWLKPVDSVEIVGSASHVVTGSVLMSSNNGSSRKQSKKSLSVSESVRDPAAGSVFWWRGGRLSRQVFHWKILPRSLASKGGRQAGCKKIPNILYPDGSEFARRSKFVAWRAAVEMSQSVAQLIFQIKEFDSNIRWTELSNSHLFPQLTNESKKLARLFKKVMIRRKCIEGTNVKYLLDFGKRECVPPVVARHGVMFEEPNSERKKYWLNEIHVPLNLLKSFEEKKIARLLKKANSGLLSDKVNNCHMKKRKRSKGLSHLILKAEKLESQVCGYCNKDVLIREAVSCEICEGYFHRRHFRVPKGAITTTYICYRCKDKNTMKIKAQGHKGVSKKRKTLTGKKSKCLPTKRKRAPQGLPRKGKHVPRLLPKKGKHVPRLLPKKGKHAVVKSEKKLNGKKKGRKGKPKKSQSRKSDNGITWPKRKRTIVHHSYWLDGLQWTGKVDNEQGKCFRRRKVLLPSQHLGDPSVKPVCCLCGKEYNSDIIYIGCESCEDWFHGDVYCLTVENINNLIGFKCHRCRRRSIPACPFSQNSVIGEGQSLDECIGGAVCTEDQNDKEKSHSGIYEDCAAIVHNKVYLDEGQKDGTKHAEEELMLSSETGLTAGPIADQLLENAEETVTSSGHQNEIQILVASDKTGGFERNGDST